MEDEIMYEEGMVPEVDITEVESEDSGISLGVAMLIGAGVIAATTAVVKLSKKAYAKFKAKKAEQESAEADDENYEEDEEDTAE